MKTREEKQAYLRAYRKTEKGKMTVINSNKKMQMRRGLQKCKKRQLDRAEFLLKAYPKAILSEVQHHLDKGRDIGTIVAWMEMPASKIQLIIQQLKSQTNINFAGRPAQ
jgi:hypothetical protein